MESIAMPRNRDFLEALLKEISGRDWKLKFSLKEGLAGEADRIRTRAEMSRREETAKAASDVSRTIRSFAKRWKFSKAKSNP